MTSKWVFPASFAVISNVTITWMLVAPMNRYLSKVNEANIAIMEEIFIFESLPRLGIASLVMGIILALRNINPRVSWIMLISMPICMFFVDILLMVTI